MHAYMMVPVLAWVVCMLGLEHVLVPGNTAVTGLAQTAPRSNVVLTGWGCCPLAMLPWVWDVNKYV